MPSFIPSVRTVAEPREERAHRAASRVALVAVLGVIALALGRLATPAFGDAPEADGVPRGAVAFFNATSCPPGWAPFAAGTGRLLVGVTQPDQTGATVGKPLSDQEDRAHQHDYAARIELPAKSIVAAGGGNKLAADPKVYEWTEKTLPGTSGYPFIQLLACERQ